MKESKEPKYRHEYKYLLSYTELCELRQSIEGLISIDPHVGKSGKYIVRSLYFDDYDNRCYYENEYGIDPREKLRIRTYNYSDARISLECKRKERGKTLKTSCQLTKDEAVRLMHGQMLPGLETQKPVLRKLTLGMMQRMMRPVTIVEYERVPFVYEGGNVRITFDMNIVSSNEVTRFFDPCIQRRPVLPQGYHLMEVKFDEYLPAFIYDALELDGLERTAFSKYYLCRKYNL